MKKIFTFVFVILVYVSCSSQTHEVELIIENHSTTDSLFIKVIPVGFIFNGDSTYHPKSRWNENYHMFGGTKFLHRNVAPIEPLFQNFLLNHDTQSPSNPFDSCIGYGKYKIEIWRYDTSIFVLKDSMTIDYSDSDYPYEPHITSFQNDFIVEYFKADSILITFANDTRFLLSATDREFEMWNQITSSHYKPQYKTGFKSNPTFTNYPSKSENYSSMTHIKAGECYVDFQIKDNGMNVITSNNLLFRNVNILMKDSANFTLNSGSSLIFESGSRFRTFETGSPKTITLHSNALIDVKSGSSVNLNNTIFQTTNSSITWKGLRLTDTYLDTINNCVFSNADTCLILSNSSECLAYNKKIITGSRFNSGVVKISNIFRSLISNDSFYSTNNNISLLVISNSVHPNDVIECEESFPGFNNNIVNNHFSGGAVQMHLNCLASELTPFFIYGNVFSGTGALTGIGMVTNKVSGDFRYNSFLNNDCIAAVDLLQSSMNLFENSSLQSGSNVTLSVNSSSSARLAPLYSDGKYYWYGGYNKLISTDGDNVYVAGASTIFLDKGGNCLTIDNPNRYHIHTALTGSCNSHGISAFDNYWSTIPPMSLLSCNSSSVPLLYEPYRDCPGAKAEPGEYEITDREDGIADSVGVTDAGDFLTGDGGDESMFAKALSKIKMKDYDESIEFLQTIIDEYDTSDYLAPAVDLLYSNHQSIDSTSLQSNTDFLFGRLKNYLESKMDQHENNISFVEKAYSYYLMCLTKVKEYNEAIAGYENIMENHPDATRRLLASWDRSAVTLLVNGSGGGNDNLTIEERNEKLLKDKPADRIAKSVFRELKKNLQSKYYTKDEREKQIETRITRFDPASQYELDERISEDMNLLLGIKSAGQTDEHNFVPEHFILHQNYPNPFNPVTKIRFDIPSEVKRQTSDVKLVVYNALGKEVAVLVNEKLSPGSYEVEFNGGNLPSGVYFYKLKAGEYEAVRKMILIR